jgi:hypothetical protein
MHEPKKLKVDDVMMVPTGGTGIKPPTKTVVTWEENKVWMQITRKINLGNYESLELGCGATVTTLPGESVTEALKRVERDVRGEFSDLMEAFGESETKED